MFVPQIDYLKLLRKTLDAAGFPNTKIVAPDSNWGIACEWPAGRGVLAACNVFRRLHRVHVPHLHFTLRTLFPSARLTAPPAC